MLLLILIVNVFIYVFYSHVQLHIYISCPDLPSHILYCRNEQTPLLALRPQLQADPSPPPGSIRGRELQTSRVSLETRPGQRLLSKLCAGLESDGL